jgi:tRNA (guanine-N7-)-methyltransferase
MNKPVFYKSFRSRNIKEKILPQKPLDKLVSENPKIILDIGFGTGDSSIALKKIYPNYTILGLEAYKPGVQRLQSKDIAVHYGDALEILESVDHKSIAQIYMLFPDPWQKLKHRKRRLFTSYTFKIIKNILRHNGLFQFTTDNINYALSAKNIIENVCSKNIEFSRSRGTRPITKYEIKAKKKRNFIFDLIYFKR